MCEFFSAVACRDGRILFCEDNSHATIIQRAGLKDDDLHIRRFVRVECNPANSAMTAWGPVRVDETSTPAWWDEDRIAWESRVLALACRVASARKAYDEACATAQKAYDEVRATARKAYYEVRATAQKAYDEACATAQKAYDEVRATAQKAYYEVRAPAQKAYVAAIESIEGYLAA